MVAGSRWRLGLVWCSRERDDKGGESYVYVCVCAPGSHKDLFISLLLFIFIIKTNATIIIKEEGGSAKV